MRTVACSMQRSPIISAIIPPDPRHPRHELRARGHRVSREVSVDVFYKGARIASQRLDMVVDDVLVIENKATELLPPNARRQLVSYLRATRLDVGLVLHFGPTPSVYRAVCTRKPHVTRLA